MGPADFYNFFLQEPGVTLPHLFSLFLLGLLRITPVVVFAPFLGSKLPGGAKIGFAISITILMLPKMTMTTHTPLDFNMVYVGFAMKELLIGLFIAVFVSIPFYIADTSGILIDFMRGAQSLAVQDPLLQTEVSPIGLLYNYVLLVLFFDVNGPFLFMQGLLDSYQIVPPDMLLSAHFFSSSAPIWEIAMGIINKMLIISIQIAAPALLAVLLAEVFLGIVNRLAPQIQIAFLGMSIKSLIGLTLMYAGWFYMLQQLAKQSIDWIGYMNKIIHSFSY